MKKIIGVFAALITTVSLCVSCIPSVEEKDAPLGTEVAPTDVQNAVDTATAQISLMNAKVGQSVAYEENYRIEMGGVVMTKRLDHELTSLTQDSTSLTCSIKEDLWTFYPSGALKDETHRALDLKFTKKQIQLNQFLHPSAAAGTLCDGTVRDDGDGIKYDCLKYYNLKFERRMVDAPTDVQKKENCMGLSKCQIDGYYVEYDQVKFLTNQVVRRVRLMAHLSAQVPDLYYTVNTDGSYAYTPATTSFCTMSLEKVEDSKYLVTFCSVLRDFVVTPGSTPTRQNN